MSKYLLPLFLLLFGTSLIGQSPAYVTIKHRGVSVTQAAADSVKKGFRGLSVVNSKVIWISGQKGLVGRSINGGKSFHWRRINGFGKLDFRTLHAFDKKTAVVATAGTPAAILRTSDGGKNWVQCYISRDSAMFFDGVGFWTGSSQEQNHGLIFGDPINGRMFLMETYDGGKHWKEIPFEDRPQLVEGEAAFAASGTTIRTLPNGHVYIATGGVKSRLWHSRDYGHHWEVFETPIIQGKPSQGIFSIDFVDTLNGVIAGGDYLSDSISGRNMFITHDGGITWEDAHYTGGYCSGVMWHKLSHTIYAVGPSRVYRSDLDGEMWMWLPHLAGYNAVVRYESEKKFCFVFAGGPGGFRIVNNTIDSRK